MQARESEPNVYRSDRLTGLGAASANLFRAHRRAAITGLVLLALASPAAARDVTQEQSAVQYALQESDRADAEHKADLEQLARTRKALEALKKQYDAEQKKADLSGKAKQQAKAKLKRAEEALDRAWKQ